MNQERKCANKPLRDKDGGPCLAQDRKPRGFYKCLETCDAELTALIVKLGRFPTKADFTNEGGNSLKAAYSRYHGGMTATRNRFGYPLSVKTHGHWKDWEPVETELLSIIQDLGEFPKIVWFKKHNRHDLLGALSRHHGGLTSAKNRLGFVADRRPHSFWKKWSNVKRELKPLIKKHGYIPSQRSLLRMGLGGLPYANANFHGGFEAVRKRMGVRGLDEATLIEHAVPVTRTYISISGSGSTFNSFLDRLFEICATERDLLMELDRLTANA